MRKLSLLILYRPGPKRLPGNHIDHGVVVVTTNSSGYRNTVTHGVRKTFSMAKYLGDTWLTAASETVLYFCYFVISDYKVGQDPDLRSGIV